MDGPITRRATLVRVYASCASGCIPHLRRLKIFEYQTSQHSLYMGSLKGVWLPFEWESMIQQGHGYMVALQKRVQLHTPICVGSCVELDVNIYLPDFEPWLCQTVNDGPFELRCNKVLLYSSFVHMASLYSKPRPAKSIICHLN